MPIPNTTARWVLAVDAGDVPSHVAALATGALPDDAPADYLRRLVADMRTFRKFTAPVNQRLEYATVRRFAPVLDDDADVDLDYHLRHSALPQPASERELGVLVSRLFSRPLDASRRLWEVHVIEGLDGRSRFAWVFKVHHGLMNCIGSSLGGRFRIGFTGCRERLPSLQRLAVHAGRTRANLERELEA